VGSTSCSYFSGPELSYRVLQKTELFGTFPALNQAVQVRGFEEWLVSNKNQLATF